MEQPLFKTSGTNLSENLSPAEGHISQGLRGQEGSQSLGTNFIPSVSSLNVAVTTEALEMYFLIHAERSAGGNFFSV